MVAYVVGMMLFPLPTTLALMLWLAMLFLLGQWLAGPTRRSAIGNALDRTFPLESPLIHHAWPTTWLVAACLIVIPAWSSRGVVERQLWKSGNFGEPPWNRVVGVSEVYLTDTQEYVMVVKFRVRTAALTDIRATTLLDPTSPPKSSEVFIGRPGSLNRIENIMSYTGGEITMKADIPIVANAKAGMHVKIAATYPITKDRSLVMLFRGPTPLWFIDAEFSRQGESSRLCGAQLDCLVRGLRSRDPSRWGDALRSYLEPDGGSR